MALYKIVGLFINYGLVALAAGQSVLDKDVEIISGKHPENPLDARSIGQYANDVYGPPVSFRFECCCFQQLHCDSKHFSGKTMMIFNKMKLCVFFSSLLFSW